MIRNHFDISEQEIMDTILSSLNITEINYKDDNETTRIISLLVSVDCIINGSFAITDDIKKTIEDKIFQLSQMIPKSSVVNDYPKAIQLRNIIDKMKEDFEDTNVEYHIDKVIGKLE